MSWVADVLSYRLGRYRQICPGCCAITTPAEHLAGDVSAIREVGDRLDGRMTQATGRRWRTNCDPDDCDSRASSWRVTHPKRARASGPWHGSHCGRAPG